MVCQIRTNNMPNNIDWNFIAKQEGRAILHGYVPQRDGQAIGASGVTIASGFDLGQHDADELSNLNLSDDLIQKLTPYLGLRKQDAIDYLTSNPLEISQMECDEITNDEDLLEYN